MLSIYNLPNNNGMQKAQFVTGLLVWQFLMQRGKEDPGHI